MFLRAKTYVDLVRRHERADALARQLANELVHLRKDNRRLQDIVIGLKREGFQTDPASTDERWPDGRYVMEEVERERFGPATPPPVPRRTPETDALDEAVEASIRADLERLHPD